MSRERDQRPGRKVTDSALDALAAALGGSIQHGTEVTGRLLEYGADLEVEVTLRVKRRVSTTQTARFRARAMAVFALERYHDRCPRWVKNRDRDGWGRKDKQCSGKVSAAIVRRTREWEVGPLPPGDNRRLVDGERFEFVCTHHADVNEPDVLAVVRLDQAHLRTLRAKRTIEDAEIRAREHAKERALAAELLALSDDALAARLADAIAAQEWGVEDACLREQRRRIAKPAVPPVSRRSA